MLLTVDVGNTTIQCGLFEGEKLALQFRRSTNSKLSSDELGLFFRDVLALNNFDYKAVERIACCSVVPAINHSLSNCFRKYFFKEALFIQAGIKTGLKIKYANPREIGADRIAGAIGAVHAAASSGGAKNLIVVDMGTATTVDVITKNNEYLGGAILPGASMSVHALSEGTAQLPSVEVVQPKNVCGSSTIEAIQSGVFYGQAGAIRELVSKMEEKVFGGERAFVIGTGGFSRSFESAGLFDLVLPDLVLQGLKVALDMNN
ncbi:MAG: type III pantothenate kinase [Treponema sp.]|jgi:type III pantothenate kinase|nr:type III pantothenate kinase [Treponema sp.]MEE3435473.1 type III pantothenate kinase [Treponema sp.]